MLFKYLKNYFNLPLRRFHRTCSFKLKYVHFFRNLIISSNDSCGMAGKNYNLCQFGHKYFEWQWWVIFKMSNINYKRKVVFKYRSSMNKKKNWDRVINIKKQFLLHFTNHHFQILEFANVNLFSRRTQLNSSKSHRKV